MTVVGGEGRGGLLDMVGSLEAGTRPDLALDARLWAALGDGDAAPPLTASLDAARGLVRRRLPGFWVTSGVCGLTGHASLGPDHDDAAARAALGGGWPEDRFHAGFDADLGPGGEPTRECRAVLHCLPRAEVARLDGAAAGGAP